MIKKQIEFDESKLEWFYQKFGQSASLSWICNLLLDKFQEACDKHPEDYAKIGAKALKEEIDDGAK